MMSTSIARLIDPSMVLVLLDGSCARRVLPQASGGRMRWPSGSKGVRRPSRKHLQVVTAIVSGELRKVDMQAQGIGRSSARQCTGSESRAEVMDVNLYNRVADPPLGASPIRGCCDRDIFSSPGEASRGR